MADQRQPFRFRLPWMPPTPTPTPAPAPAPAPRQPAAAPPRPPFRPGGVAPTQPPPRAIPPPPPPPPPPKASEQASPPKPAPPPKTGPASKPIASTPSPPKTEPPSKPIAPTPSPPSKPIASTLSPPSKPIAPTPSRPSKPIASTLSPPSKPIASTLSPPSKPIASTSTPPKTRSPSPSVSTPKEAKTAISQPISPPKPPTQSATPKSPSGSPARPKPASPSSSSPPSSREKALEKPHDSPKREPSPTLKYPNSPTMVDQGSSSKKELEKLQAQQQQAAIASENASANGKLPQSSPDPIQKPVTSIPDIKEPKEVKRVIDESIIKQNGEPRKKEVVTEVPESETILQPVSVSRVGQRPAERTYIPSYPKASKPHNNHKPVWEKPPLQKEIKEDISKFVHKLGIGQGKQTLDGEKQLTVITLAGENRGASMTLSNESRKKESSIHIHRGYKANPDEAIENSTDGEENSKAKEETTTKAYINSNVQGINNSLLFNGSVSTMNPGVWYVRSHNLKEGSKGRRHDQAGNFETNKAEFSGTQSEMLAYAPNVRKRCLRELLMESSDSDPEKPRRHGCQYECKDKNKDEDVDVP